MRGQGDRRSGATVNGPRPCAFELGADDWVTKPFSLRELIARICAVMRRGKGEGVER